MSLRKLQRKTASLLRDGGLFKALQSELKHELSSSSPPPLPLSSKVGSSVGDFAVEWDDSRTQDVVLRRRWASGGVGDGEEEEIAVSALLGPVRFEGEDPMPREALMKVCVKKLGFDPVLRFDCCVSENGFDVRSACYHRSLGNLGSDKYRGPQFSSLDPQLQKALKEYLEARGITLKLTSFLHQHLHNKEHGQYVNWLQTLERYVTNNA